MCCSIEFSTCLPVGRSRMCLGRFGVFFWGGCAVPSQPQPSETLFSKSPESISGESWFPPICHFWMAFKMMSVLWQVCIPAGCIHRGGRNPFPQQHHTSPAGTLIKLGNAEFGECTRSLSALSLLLPGISWGKTVSEQCPGCSKMVILLGTS